ncbi:MAG: tetratricopeptide repeat protein [Bacteroidales bacterium]|jgi:YesN/AraC family two-component response regulator|nr:tetratricopeptide repeat protein [Bacteroidales bacterium]
MVKKIVFIVILIFSVVAVRAQGQGFSPDTSVDGLILPNYKELSLEQLFDTATSYFYAGHHKQAQICYDLLIQRALQYPDNSKVCQLMGKAYHYSAIVQFSADNYRLAYEQSLKAIEIAEEFEDSSQLARNYITIGNIYFRFNRYDLARAYYLDALSFAQDSGVIFVSFSNLGYIEMGVGGNLDSAVYFLNQSSQVARKNNATTVHNNFGSYYKQRRIYDSALIHYNLALEGSGSYDRVREKAMTLSNLGKLFLEMNQLDSAIIYFEQSNAVANEYRILGTLMDNYLTLYQIAKQKGENALAVEYLDRHLHLKDTIFNREKIIEITELQRMHETAKTDRQIAELMIEKRIKDGTIFWQQIVFLLVCSILLFILFQKRKQDKVNKLLFEKSVEAVEAQEDLGKVYQKKYKKSKLAEKTQDELWTKILAIMEDTSIVCDTKFSLGTLVELTHSNSTYVSQIIYNATKKNFRSFLNSYRIREAQRLFSEQGAEKYTIEAVAIQVGFKSRSTFYDAFKEINGISPNFYLKSLQRA